MSNLRHDLWHKLIGRSITSRFDPHVFITFEESWLKQLRTQYMLGVPEPLLRLPGVIGKYKTNSDYQLTTGYFPEGAGRSKPRIIADRINEPGCEWQLRVIRGTNE